MNLESNMRKYAIQQTARNKSSKTKKKPEKVIQDGIVKLFCSNNFFVMRLNSGTLPSIDTGTYFSAYSIAGLGKSGAADLLVGRAGLIVFVEIKTQSGRQSDSQHKFEKFVKAMGYDYFLCRNIDDGLKIVEFIKNKLSGKSSLSVDLKIN